jgi:F-type H+-transporting ATPase subunit a
VRAQWAAKTIEVGKYPTVKFLGLTIDTNIVASTLLAALIVFTMFYFLRRKATSGVPGKFQLIFEILTVDIVGALAESAIGEKAKKYVPLGVGIFVWILVCNWINVIPSALAPGKSYELIPAPTSNVNLPLAMALFVIVWVHIESLRARKVKGYVKHYLQPHWLMSPINVIEEITKPITLTFRLFGNLFSGGLMIVVMTTLLPIYVVPVGEIVWKPFDDLFLGGIQAYIFMLLTILYFGMATSHDEPHPATHAGATPALATAH